MWRERRADWLRGWPEGLSRSDCCGVLQNVNSVVYYSHGAHFVEVCSVERLKSVCSDLKNIYVSATAEEALLVLDVR